MKNQEWKQSFILYYSLFLLNIISYFVLNSVIEVQSNRVRALYVHMDVVSMISLMVSIIVLIVIITMLKYYSKKILIFAIGVEIVIAALVLFSPNSAILLMVVILNSVATVLINVTLFIEISKIAIREKQHAKVMLSLFLFSTISILFCAIVNNIGLYIPIKLWIISVVIILLELLNLYWVSKFFPQESFKFLYRHRKLWFKRSISPSLRGVMLTAFCMVLIASFALQIYLRWMPNYMGVLYNASPDKIKLTTLYFYIAVILSILFSRKVVSRISPVKLLMLMQLGLILSVIFMELLLQATIYDPSSMQYYSLQFNIIVFALGFFLGSSVPLIISTALTSYRLNQQYMVSAILVLGLVIGNILGRNIFEDFIGIPMITSISAPVIILFLLVIYYDYLRKMQVKRIKQHE